MKLDPETAGSLKKLAEKVRNAADENARIEAIQDLQAALNALRPSGLSRKIATTQTIEQLLNPKTQVRNILGNELFYRLERISELVQLKLNIGASDGDSTPSEEKRGTPNYRSGGLKKLDKYVSTPIDLGSF